MEIVPVLCRDGIAEPGKAFSAAWSQLRAEPKVAGKMEKGELRGPGVQGERDFMEGVGILRKEELPGWKNPKFPSQHPRTGAWVGRLDSTEELQSRKFCFPALLNMRKIWEGFCVAQNREERRFCGCCLQGTSRAVLF